jgi:hypothetical protein
MLRKMTALAAGVAALALAGSASAGNLIVNGDFETGDLSGWSVVDSGSGSWFATLNGAGSPLNSFASPFLATGGDWNAQTDQGGPGSHDLSQTLLLGGGNYKFQFDAYGNDQSGSGGAGDQQYLVIDDSTALLGPLVDPAWAHFSFDLTLGAGLHTFTFHENDDRSFYNAAVDNVSLTTSSAPEPAAWALMIGGFGLAGASLRRRKAAVAAA